MFDVAYGLACRAPLTKLVKLDGDILPCLTTLMVAALAWVKEAMLILEGLQITTMTREAFDNILLKEASHNYDNYSLVSRLVMGLGLERMPKEVNQVLHKRYEFKLNYLILAMTSLN